MAWNDFMLDEVLAFTIAMKMPAWIASARVHGLRYTVSDMLIATDAWIEA